jgi:hypothetical protein
MLVPKRLTIQMTTQKYLSCPSISQSLKFHKPILSCFGKLNFKATSIDQIIFTFIYLSFD